MHKDISVFAVDKMGLLTGIQHEEMWSIGLFQLMFESLATSPLAG